MGISERGRGVNLEISKEIMAKWHVLNPTGAEYNSAHVDHTTLPFFRHYKS